MALLNFTDCDLITHETDRLTGVDFYEGESWCDIPVGMIYRKSGEYYRLVWHIPYKVNLPCYWYMEDAKGNHHVMEANGDLLVASLRMEYRGKDRLEEDTLQWIRKVVEACKG
jgi:hypothetical protein